MSTRSRRGALQVATDIFHDRDGKTVTLIGVCHVADQAFWDDTQKLLADLQARDNEVHFEGTTNDVPDLKPFLPDYAKMAKVMGLVDQGTGLKYDRAAWRNTDVTMSFLMAAAEPGRLAKWQDRDWDDFIHQIEETNMGPAMHWFLRHITRMPMIGRYSAAGIPRSILLGYRNRVAAHAALATPGDVAALWGAAHLPGIGQLLKDAGYCHHARIWRTAINPPRGRHA